MLMLMLMLMFISCHVWCVQEATKTYTSMLKQIDDPHSHIHSFSTEKAPAIAIAYWKLKEDATVRDVVLQIRADEVSTGQRMKHMLTHIDACATLRMSWMPHVMWYVHALSMVQSHHRDVNHTFADLVQTQGR